MGRQPGDVRTSKVMADDDFEMATSYSLVQDRSLQDRIIGMSRRKTREDISPLGTSCPSDVSEQSNVMTDTQNAEYTRADVVMRGELGKIEMV